MEVTNTVIYAGTFTGITFCQHSLGACFSGLCLNFKNHGKIVCEKLWNNHGI